MSLFGAIGTAISGLTAESAAFGNISEDVANSQTVGFKRVDTSFVDYLTTSTPADNEPGAVVARPDYINDIQGTVTQTDNPLGMAIAGQGFFAVSQPIGEVNGVTTYNPQQFYTRAGDFTMNATGYLVNSAGQYLNGWAVDPTTNVANQNALVPIQVNQQTFDPVATTNVTLAANLPATPTAGTATNAIIPPATAPSPLSSQITVYDALGTAHPITLNWTQNSANNWTVQAEVPDAVGTLANGTTPNYTNAGSATVTFGGGASTLPPAGTIDSVTPIAAVAPAVVAGTGTAGANDTIAITTNTDGSIASYVESDATGAAVSTVTFPVNSTTPFGGVPGAPGVPVVTTSTAASTGVASDTTVKSVAKDGIITFVETNDSGNSAANGTTITTTTIPPDAGTLTGGGSFAAGSPAQPATLSFTTNFGSGNQTIQINLGNYGSASGVTQFAGSTYSLLGLTQNGVPPGSFSGVTTQANGNVIVNYNNGQTRTIAEVPVVTFNAPDSLQSQNGESFTATPSSGAPLAQAASTNGAGNLVTGSVEGSNVDIATEFSNLIVAQQAYSSNAKVVTTANAMLQATLQMVA
jgi:flagellar hook protein FlgE